MTTASFVTDWIFWSREKLHIFWNNSSMCGRSCLQRPKSLCHHLTHRDERASIASGFEHLDQQTGDAQQQKAPV